MSRTFTLKLCYALCFALVLLVFPVMGSSASKAAKVNKTIEKAERSVAKQEAEILHSELLFK